MSDRQREVKVMASEIKETVVSIKDAYLRYASEKGSVTALENVNLEIEKVSLSVYYTVRLWQEYTA